MGAARARGVSSLVPFPLQRISGRIQQPCCVDLVHRITFLADIVAQVKRAAGVYDSVHETLERDKKIIQQSLHKQQNWSFQDFFLPFDGPRRVGFILVICFQSST